MAWLKKLFSLETPSDLENRVRRLEERDSERHMVVLAAAERVAHQLRDRTKKREELDAAPPSAGDASAPGEAPRKPLRSMRAF